VQVFNLHRTISGVAYPQVKTQRPLLGPAVTHGSGCPEWVQVFNLHETIAGVAYPQVKNLRPLLGPAATFEGLRPR
jgi:hypothetical protein